MTGRVHTWFRRTPRANAMRYETLSLTQKRWLLLVSVGLMMLHLPQLPIWMTAFVALLICWQFYTQHRPIKKLTKAALMLIAGAGVLVSAAHADGLAGLSILLVAGAALKLLELNSRRDGWAIIMVAFFTIAVSFLFDQSMLLALVGVMVFWVTLTATIVMHRGQDARIKTRSVVQQSGVLLLQSIPVMVVLFVVFPRIGPLWSVQYKHAVAKTGLSETMSPGSVQQLTRNTDIAFRVEFTQGEAPLPEQRYWRSMTMSHFDGRTWYIEESATDQFATQMNDAAVEYRVVMEPTGRPWLSVLDYPVSFEARSYLTLGNQTIKSTRDVDSRLSYRAVSVASEGYLPEAPLGRRYLRVPDQSAPRTRVWLEEQGLVGEPAQTVKARLIELFNRSFRYTLSPTLVSGDSTDGFLFDTQEGFCEHFASATAIAFRLAGIPARVVGGYLGGEWNAVEGYMTVRQYEAHAWVEYWEKGKGWVRFDPTAAVAPERVELSFDQLFSDDQAFAADAPISLIRFEKHWSFISGLRQQYDALNYRWHRMVLDYQSQDNEWLQDWLNSRYRWVALALIVIIPGVCLGLVLLWMQRKKARYTTVVGVQLEKISHRLSKVDRRLQRKSGETAAHYLARLVELYPALSEPATQWLNAAQGYYYNEREAESGKLHDAWKPLWRSIQSMAKHHRRS
jgi:transglutaminase-like putative cysteine protease